MEGNIGSPLDRRGSLYFSPSSLDVLDSAKEQPAKLPSPEKRLKPVVNISRHRNISETQYADTEVSLLIETH